MFVFQNFQRPKVEDTGDPFEKIEKKKKTPSQDVPKTEPVAQDSKKVTNQVAGAGTLPPVLGAEKITPPAKDVEAKNTLGGGKFEVGSKDRIVKVPPAQGTPATSTAQPSKGNYTTSTFYGALAQASGIAGYFDIILWGKDSRSGEIRKLFDKTLEEGTMVRRGSAIYDVVQKGEKFGYEISGKFKALQPGDEVVFKAEYLQQIEKKLNDIGWKTK